MAFKMKGFSGFGNSPMKNIKNFEKFQAQKTTAKNFVKNLLNILIMLLHQR